MINHYSVLEYIMTKEQQLREKKMKNEEGYPDPTATKAIQIAEKPPKYIREILNVLDQIARISKVEIITIENRDKETKKLWRRTNRNGSGSS